MTLPLGTGTNYLPNNSQVDNAGIDVRLTQLRNLLAGTRPQANPNSPDLTGTVNGDNNYVFYSTGPSAESVKYYMPNGIVDTLASSPLQPSAARRGSNRQQQRFALRRAEHTAGRRPVGRGPVDSRQSLYRPARQRDARPHPAPPALVGVVAKLELGEHDLHECDANLLRIPNGNPVRAGYSMDIGDIINGLPRDAADDNFNAYDPFPVRPSR